MFSSHSSRVSKLPTDGAPPDDANDELAEAIADALVSATTVAELALAACVATVFRHGESALGRGHPIQ